ncbi:MAG: hypothetical protein JRI34_01005 [Deltaproteobacteria bacterium]|nr:hypothetical protein [Deltaproteobacteria bacterium]
MGKNLLENNLSCLAKQDQELAAQIISAAEPDAAQLKKAKSGDWTLIMNGISMHSRFDPVSEGERLANSPIVGLAQTNGLRLAVFGLGLGYHVRALAKKLNEIWVIEPNPGLIRLAFRHLNFSAFMDKLHFVLTLSSDAFWPPTVLIPHPPSRRLDPESYALWADFLNNKRENEATVETLKDALSDQSGVEGILVGLDPERQVNLAELAQKIENQEGHLTEAEITILLLYELACASSPKGLNAGSGR